MPVDVDWFKSGPAKLAGIPCGMYKVKEVVKMTKVNPLSYPQYFHVGPINGFVSKTDLFRDHYEAYRAYNQHNWAALGIPA